MQVVSLQWNDSIRVESINQTEVFANAVPRIKSDVLSLKLSGTNLLQELKIAVD